MPSPPPIPTDPAALPFLPLIYVAWADGDLTALEIDKIRGSILETPSIRPDTRKALSRWLDPDQPPPPRSLVALLAHVREKAAALPVDRRRTLAELGGALAGDGVSPETVAALEAVEAALGLVGAEAARDLLAGAEPVALRDGPAAMDVAALARWLDRDQRELRQAVREALARPEFAHEYGLSKEAYRKKTLERCKILAAHGFGALSFPRAYGGEDDPRRLLVVFETLAAHDLSLTIKFGVQFGLFGGAVHQLGTDRHHSDYLAKIGTLELPGCFAMTELGHGSNVFDIETEARYDPATRELVVHTPSDSARKEYIGNAAADGRLAVVFAQLIVAGERHGVHAVLTPIRNPDGSTADGVRIADCGEKLGLNGVDNGRLWFDHVRVPRQNLLNRYADISDQGEYVSAIPSPSKRFFTTIGALVAGRISVALGALSAMKAGLTIALRYGESRRQFGAAGEQEVRLLDYRTHQRRLLPPLAAAYALHFALHRLSDQFADRARREQREFESLAAGLKAYATWRNIETLQACRECCGGQGYLSVNRFAALRADSDIFCTFEGDNTVLMQLVAKSLLSDYRRQFEDLRPFTLLKYIAARAADVAGEPSPVAARQTDSRHLRSAEFLLDALRYRENRLLSSAARRLSHQIGEGVDSFHAFTACQDHLLATANAHVERIVLETFAEALETCDDPPLRDALASLISLFALWRIEQDRAWFLEAGYISSAKGRAIRKEVNQLCAEIRPAAVDLVDAFAIPDSSLGAPIAVRSPPCE